MADLRVPDLNVIYIAGRLTRDPELKYTQSGRAYCRLGVANTRYFRTREGERREETTFVNASCWDKQAEFIGERLRKGRPILIEGSLRSYEIGEGDDRSKRIEINARRVTPLDWDESGPGGSYDTGGAARGASRAPARSESYEDPSYGGGARGSGSGSGPGGEQGRPRPIEEPEPESNDDIPF